MSVYVGERPCYLDEALTSVWNQTLRPAQVVLVIDGPLSSGLTNVVARWTEQLGPSLTVVSLPTNVGLGEALNAGLEYCRHELIARADSDDIQTPTRFEQQAEFMMRNPNIVVSSGWVEEFETGGEVFAVRKLPTKHDDIARFARKRCPISHPAAIFQRDVVRAVGGYPRLRKSQDYGLWALLLVRGHRFANIPRVLCRMRVSHLFGRGRGGEQLRNEWSMLRFQYRIGFLGRAEFVRNLAIRIILRLLPSPLKRFLYRHGRR